MQLINEAWRVLSDGVMRAEFDAATAPQGADGLAGPDSPTPTVDEDAGGFVVTPRMAMLLRVGPWVLAATLALGLIVVTAYAGDSDEDGEVMAGDCIVFQGPAAYSEVSCRGVHDAVVAAITSGECEADQRPFEPRSSDLTFCLVGGS